MRTLIGMAVAVALLAAPAAVDAQWVGYDPQADERPDSNWALVDHSGGIDDPITSVSDGVASITTTSSTGKYNRDTGFRRSTGFTVDWREREISHSSANTGMAIRFVAENPDDPAAGMGIVIKVHGRANADNTKGRVTLAWSGRSDEYSTVYDDNEDWHTFRFAALDSDYALYMDDVATPISEGTLPDADRGASFMSFGDWGGSSVGSAQLDFLVWDDTQAIFEPPLGDQELVGDANKDGVVNDADLSLLLAHWDQDVTGEPDGGWGKGEFDGTAPVQDNDLSLLLANWTAAAAVPEPATMSLMAIAGLGLIRKRKQHL